MTRPPARRASPLISVIICTYRRPQMALKAIRSVLAQEFADYELLVVDQDSTDGLEAFVRAAVPGEAPIRYVRAVLPGVSHARNVGAQHARGEVLAFLDDDARALPGWLASYAELLAGPAPPAMVGGRLVPEWQSPRPRWYPACRLYLLGLYDIGQDVTPFPGFDLPMGANFALRKDELLRWGGFDVRLGFDRSRSMALAGEESLLAARIRHAGGRLLHHPGATAAHLVRPEKLRFSYFLRRHFIEGRTQIAVAHGVSEMNVPALLGAINWHVWRRVTVREKWSAWAVKFEANPLECLADSAASMALSLGVVFESARLLIASRRRAAGAGPACVPAAGQAVPSSPSVSPIQSPGP